MVGTSIRITLFICTTAFEMTLPSCIYADVLGVLPTSPALGAFKQVWRSIKFDLHPVMTSS